MSASSCQSPPVPDVDMDILPGFFFAASITSSRVLYGESGRTDQLAMEFADWKYCQSSQALESECPITRTNLL